MAKTALDRYIFHFERWDNHAKAKKLAEEQRTRIGEVITLLHDLKQYPISEIEYLSDGIEATINTRRVLASSYIYLFYLPEGKEKKLFRYLQQRLEQKCDYLHELLEKRPFDPFLDPDTLDKAPFYQYKSELVNYYQVTQTVFI
jgi:ariadne-1